ncbi:MAG: FAD-binding protein, partial [Planctomycetaceae bacterium]|nr:FAD-binding protein [Planctomycetaceae bacterium]
MSESWSNWAGSVHCLPGEVARPTCEAEIQELIARCRSTGQRIRVVGSGHSFTPLCATDEVLVSLDQWCGIEKVNRARGEATIRAGSKIHDIGDPLWEEGLSLANQGDVDVQALAGAISTGTHGTG